MGGLLLAMSTRMIMIPLQHFFNIGLLTRLTVQMLGFALCPVYWIYMSDKLRAVLRKWMGSRW